MITELSICKKTIKGKQSFFIMKKLLYVFIILGIVINCGCNKKSQNYTTYMGVVVEQNSLNPISNLPVTITDGINIYSEAVTNSAGQFSIDMAHNSSLGYVYIFIDGNEKYPSKNVDLVQTDGRKYDYGFIYLYNQTDASLYPKIKNVTWDYLDGANSIRFKDILINSDYSLIDAYVEISQNENFAQSQKYQLEELEDGRYSVIVDNLTIGERYFFQVVAFNTIGTGRSEVYSRIYGIPNTSIIELVNATVNSATIKINVSEEPLSTLQAGVCWSTSHNPTMNNYTQNGGTAGTSEVTIYGLDFRMSTYYVRAYAQNANGIAYSEELVLPVNNPYSLPTFTSEEYTYTYLYLGYGSWYTAHDACESLVYVFDDWTLPSRDIMSDFLYTYYEKNGEMLLLPVWSRHSDEWWENGEEETFMLTYNGYIWAPKNQNANYYAVRKFRN